ncbi:MAG: hypothetical protein KDD47_27465, partial [Acidobacteria bacterium]|nr:hypothetical protein [Acidobacteriota bacterium]
FVPAGFFARLGLALAYVGLAPPALTSGFRSGNLSFAVVGAGIAAFLVWRERPGLAGVLLGVSSVVKPITPVGIVVLGAHRAESSGWRHRIASATGLLVAGGLSLATPYLWDYLSAEHATQEWPLRRAVSLYRFVELLGVSVHPAVLVLAVGLVFAWIGWRHPRSPRQVVVLGLTAMALATPALWSHSLLIVAPLAVMSLVKAGERYRDRRSRAAVYELVVIALIVLALQLSNGIGGGAEGRSSLVQIAFLILPVGAPVGLAFYLWRSEGSGPSSSR